MKAETYASDRVELRALVDGYALAVDDGDSERFKTLFLPDATLSAFAPGVAEPRLSLVGVDEIWAGISPQPGLTSMVQAGISDGAPAWTRSFHCNMNHVCEVEGDEATGVMYCRTQQLIEGANGATNKTAAVRYFDRYSRRDGVWRFASRELRILWFEEAPTQPVSPFTLNEVSGAAQG